mmetsp:Transcript_64347/g.184765  ORF Transcript_64347/g.184765 Transcript_64347/m.184765 type:complete len:220 (+) Transcript_64347:739-1398(+)
MPGVREAPRDADGAQLRDHEEVAEVLHVIPSSGRRARSQVHLEDGAALHQRHLLGLHPEVPELRPNLQGPLLRQDQHVAVHVPKVATPGAHAGVHGVHICRTSILRRWIAVRRNRHRAIHEISRRRWGRNRRESELSRRTDVLERWAHPRRVRPVLVGRECSCVVRGMLHGWPDPVEPRVPVLGTRDRKGGAGEQFRVEAIRWLLWRVLLPRQRPGQRL